MRVSIGCDHAGFPLKAPLVEALEQGGHEVVDCGTWSTESVDYIPYCADAARRVRDGEADFGIVLGGSGQGEQLAANKVQGVRAALCTDIWLARLARQHNDANVVAMGARHVAPYMAVEILNIFLGTAFEGGRHQARVDKLTALEQDEARAYVERQG